MRAGRHTLGWILAEIRSNAEVSEKNGAVIVNEQIGSFDITVDKSVYVKIAS